MPLCAVSTPDWIREVYGFALKPDRVFYLRAGVDDLVTRVLQEGCFDYWESGMDLHLGDDMYESFVEYQNRMMAQFDKMVEDYGFKVIDARHPIDEVFADLKAQVSEVLTPARPRLERFARKRPMVRRAILRAESLENSLRDNGRPSEEPSSSRADEIRAHALKLTMLGYELILHASWHRGRPRR